MQSKINSYEKAVSVLTSQGKFHIKLGLERIKSLLELYGNPQDKIKCIHVAGTNGKGSTCAMLASVLQHAGYKTGLYTSPHLLEYTERIKINDVEIPQQDFADLIFDIIETAEKNAIHVTEFEILTALAFIYYEREKIDFAIIETGLGGRLDATNIIKNPLLSIITTIDYDHVDRLGDTIDKIAFEKAGIIKPHVPIITLKDNNGLEVIKEKAFQSNSELILADESKIFLDCFVEVKTSPRNDNCSYQTNLKGVWQKKNLSLVLKAVELLRKNNVSITENALTEGLKDVCWAGRFQYIEEFNLILDGAHNPNAAKLLRESLDVYYPDKNRVWIYSSINTKNYEEIMEILFRHGDIIILTQSCSGAAVSPDILSVIIRGKMKNSQIYKTFSVKEALDTYSQFITNKHISIMAGSLYTIGDFISEYKNCRL